LVLDPIITVWPSWIRREPMVEPTIPVPNIAIFIVLNILDSWTTNANWCRLL